MLSNISYACACKRKTTGYYLQMGEVQTTAIRISNQPGITQSLTGVSADPAAGRKTIISRKSGNCLACHKINKLSDQPFQGDVGPTLNRIANRYTEGQLRQILVDSRKYFPKTSMPPFYTKSGMLRVRKKYQGKTILTAQQVEDVLAFLKTLK